MAPNRYRKIVAVVFINFVFTGWPLTSAHLNIIHMQASGRRQSATTAVRSPSHRATTSSAAMSGRVLMLLSHIPLFETVDASKRTASLASAHSRTSNPRFSKVWNFGYPQTNKCPDDLHVYISLFNSQFLHILTCLSAPPLPTLSPSGLQSSAKT